MPRGKTKFTGPPGGGPKKKSKVTVASVNAKVNRLIRATERKSHDVTVTAVSIPLVGSVVSLNKILGATGESDGKEGRKVSMTSLHFRSYIGAAFDAITGVGIYRAMVVLDKRSDGALPAVTDILKTADPFSPLNVANSDRFVVLYDDTNGIGASLYELGGTTSLANRTQTSTTVKYMNLKGKLARYADDSTKEAIEGAIYYVSLGTDGPGTGPYPGVVNFQSRLRYTDS